MPATDTLRVAGFLTWRTISRGNRSVVLLTTAMMAVIFAELLFIPSLIQGANERIESELRDNLTSNITVTPAGSTLTIPDAAGLVDLARATPGVAAATSLVLAGTQISAGSHTGSWSVGAVDPASYAATFPIGSEIAEGAFLAPGDGDAIVLGLGIAGAGRADSQTYRSSLQSVHAGDRVTVTLLGGQTHDFRVKGIYDSQLAQANQRAFIPVATAARLVPATAGQANTVFIRTQHIGQEADVVAQLQRTRPDVVYQPWQTLEAAVSDLTGSFDIIRTILNAVSLLVAAITVFIVTYVDLVSKRRTMGIERAIGITGAAIVLSYVLKAICFAVIGVVLGAALFKFVAVPLVDQHPFQFPIGPVILSVTSRELRHDAIVLVIVASLGALAPAWRSVRIGILDAIWG